MAGTKSSDFGNWLDGLNEVIAYETERMITPLEQMHNSQRLGFGQDAVIFPYVADSLSMGAVTQGTAYNTQTKFSISGLTVTPVPYEAQIRVTEHAIRSNPSNYMRIVADQFAQANHANLVTLLTRQYDDLQGSAAATGATLNVTGFSGTRNNIRTSGHSGLIFAVLSPKQFGDLENDLMANYSATNLASQSIGQGPFQSIVGVNTVMDSNVVVTGSDSYCGFMGTRDCIGIGWGLDQGLKVLEGTDATHMILARSVWLAVGTPAANQGRYVKTL